MSGTVAPRRAGLGAATRAVCCVSPRSLAIDPPSLGRCLRSQAAQRSWRVGARRLPDFTVNVNCSFFAGHAPPKTPHPVADHGILLLMADQEPEILTGRPEELAEQRNQAVSQPAQLLRIGAMLRELRA